MALQHLRTSTAHKRPIPSVMSAGQLAVNINEASPGLFFKDSNGDLVKVGPVHIGTDAPNSSPASVAATALVTGTVYQILTVGTSDFTGVGASANTVGTVFTATGTTTGTGTVSGQQGVEKGEQWLDTTGGTYVLKIYDGTAWRSESGTFVDVNGDTMTGALLLDNASSAAAPDLSFDGDADTGIYSPGADRVAISTAGAGRLFIDNVGNVGAGTSTPESKFHARADGNDVKALLFLQNRNGGANSGVQISLSNALNDQSENRLAYIRALSTGSSQNGNEIAFGTNPNGGPPVERMRVDSSGRLLVGATSGSYDFEVKKSGHIHGLIGSTNAAGATLLLDGDSNGDGAGSDYASISHNSDGNFVFENRKSASLIFRNTSSSTERMRITSSGDVQTRRSRSNTAGDVALSVQPADSTIHYGFRVDQANNHFNLDRADNNSTLLTVDGSGNVGINGAATAASSTKTLQITDSVTARMLFESTGSGGRKYGWYTSVDGQFAAYDYTANAERMRISSAGYVGIGTASPERALVVSDAGTEGFEFYPGSSTGNNTVNHYNRATASFVNIITTADQHIFGRADGEKVRINSSGNVGIGTSNPVAKLHTVGTVLHEGDVEIRPENTGGEGGQIAIYNPDKTSVGATIDVSTANAFRIFQLNNNSIMELGQLSGTGGVIKFATSGSERVQIDSAGRLLLGTSVAGTGAFGTVPSFHAASSSSTNTFQNFGATTFGARIDLCKTRGTSANAHVVIQNNDTVGGIHFAGSDGTNYAQAAQIEAFVDGAPGNDDMPGRLTFSTTPNGAQFAQERMRINNAGLVGIGTTSVDGQLEVRSESSLGIVSRSTNTQSTHTNKAFKARNNSGTDTFTVSYKGRGYFGAGLDVQGESVTFGPTTTTDQYQGLTLKNGKDSSAAVTTSYIDFRNNVDGVDAHFFCDHNTDGSSTLIFGTTPAGVRNVDRRQERVRITGDGKVGIGTSNPTEILEAVASSPTVCIRDTQTSITTARAALRLAESGAGNSVDNYWDLVADNTAGNFGFSIKEGTDTRFAIKAGNGNVGIGTSSPDAPLEVVRSSTGEVELARFRIEGQTNNPMLRFHSDESQKVLTIGTSGSVSGTHLAFDTQSGEAMRIASNSNVGIGTASPGSRLHVSNGNDAASGEFVGLTIGGTNQNNARTASLIKDTTTYDLIYKNNNFSSALGNHIFKNGNSEHMRIDSSGKVGIGTSSPTLATLHINQGANGFALNLQEGSSANPKILFTTTAGNTGATAIEGDPDSSSGFLAFTTGNSESARINSSGALLIGRTANTDTAALCVDQDVSGGNVGISTITTSTSSRFHLLFRNGNGQVGSIATDGSATAFNTSSDYRLKENVVDLDGAIDRVKQLAPKRFNFIANADTTVDGFLAHEAQTVVPEAVTGTHNEVDVDGNAVMQGIDQSKLVPLLTAALKEAIAKIETLEQRLTDAGL